MSFPPPTVPPLGGPPGLVAGWYDDPWDHLGLRWWDGEVWTGYTDEHFHGPGARSGADITGEAVAPVRANVATTRALALLLPLGAVGQVASLATSSSALRTLWQQARAGGVVTAPNQGPLSGPMALGQVLSLLTLVVLVVRILWLLRATRAARALGDVTRRAPGWACAGWIIPVVNLWWPRRGIADVAGGTEEVDRMVRWWWATYLIGILGGAAAVMLSWSLTVAGSVAAMALPAASLLVSALLERRLIVAAHRQQMSRVGLTLA